MTDLVRSNRKRNCVYTFLFEDRQDQEQDLISDISSLGYKVVNASSFSKLEQLLSAGSSSSIYVVDYLSLKSVENDGYMRFLKAYSVSPQKNCLVLTLDSKRRFESPFISYGKFAFHQYYSIVAAICQARFP